MRERETGSDDRVRATTALNSRRSVYSSIYILLQLSTCLSAKSTTATPVPLAKHLSVIFPQWWSCVYPSSTTKCSRRITTTSSFAILMNLCVLSGIVWSFDLSVFYRRQIGTFRQTSARRYEVSHPHFKSDNLSKRSGESRCCPLNNCQRRCDICFGRCTSALAVPNKTYDNMNSQLTQFYLLNIWNRCVLCTGQWELAGVCRQWDVEFRELQCVCLLSFSPQFTPTRPSS